MLHSTLTPPGTSPSVGTSTPQGSLARPPRALLLDFGGVIFLTSKKPEGRDDYVARLATLLTRAGHDIDHAVLRRSLDAGLTALKHWKHASSRRRTPREMTHREIVGDFLASDLPAAARATLVAEAHGVLEMLTTTLSSHQLRPGITDLIATAHAHHIPLVIVSNAHSGSSHRELLAAHGLGSAFAAQIYSDEVGMRKPHPGMLHLAAEAAGVDIADCWYVGDTLDRDVVTGRRAGVGAVFITRSQHSDNPPFAVDAVPDAIFDTPEGLLEALAHALASAPLQASPRAPERSPASRPTPRERPALFLDHGGVISASEEDPDLLTSFAEHLAALLTHPTEPVSVDHARDLLTAAKDRHRALKRSLRHNYDAGTASLREVTPEKFWTELLGRDLSARQRAILRIEGFDLMARYGRAKSRRTLRPGVRELLITAQDLAMPVVVVSNTISGRAVRAECAAHGLTDLIGAYVCSDELGLRKPEPAILAEALQIARADPGLSWFVGDKPDNDARVALTHRIAHRVLVRGGSTPDPELDTALASGLATVVASSLSAVSDLVRAHHGLVHPRLAVGA